MTVEESWADALRAEALAKLLLTERGDLEVIEEPAGAGYDVLVRVLAEDSILVPEFAVEVKGTRRRITTQRLREWLVNMRVPESAGHLPWCLFVFQVESRKGMYCWLHEPIVFENGAAIRSVWDPRTLSSDLQRKISLLPSLSPLNEQALDLIVSQVVRWARAQEYAQLRHARAS
jgi:hypothetical protein